MIVIEELIGKNSQTAGIGYSHYNHLFGKVVLLIGGDTVVLPSLIIQLAQKGADIALVCQQLSRERVRRIKESVESLGRHFLLINETDVRQTPSDLIQVVVSRLGHLDVFIDLSTQKNRAQKGLAREERDDSSGEREQPHWKLIYAAMEEIVES